MPGRDNEDTADNATDIAALGDPPETTDAVDDDDDADDDDDTDDGVDRQAPPPEVTRDLFLVFRSPRVALRNPQRMTNPVWAWLARQREVNAWAANKRFDGPSSFEVGPGWCANRFGRSSTTLADGRVVEIAGEHEDYYDPDFCIYNDVVVTDPSGALEIYGYPHEVFPPTDFHTATLVGGRIVIIGSTGYAWLRTPGHTPVFALDTASWTMSRVSTSGDMPGWISRHHAELTADATAIVLGGGQRYVMVDGEADFFDNIDEWSLDLDTGVWTRLTDRRWLQWDLMREDGSRNDLWQINSGAFHVGAATDWDREQLARCVENLGRTPDFAVYAQRFVPPVPHTRLRSDDEAWNETKIIVDGVTVLYREESQAVRVRIEGSLPADVAAAIVEDARHKLEALEQRTYVARALAHV